MLIRTGGTICNYYREIVRPFHFDKRPTPEFHSFASAIPIMIFLPPEVIKERKGPSPLRPVVGEEGFEPPTPWFVATCSNPLSYRPHPVSTGSVPGSTLQKEPFLSSAILFQIKKMWKRVSLYSIRTVRCSEV